MSNPLSIAVIGGGNVARGAYLPLLMGLRHSGLVDRVVVADINQAQLDLVGALFAFELTTDIDTSIDDPDIDVVVILTSMLHHGSLAARALRAGKHVMVEKPMATTLEQAAELVAMAKDTPGYLLCAPYVTLSPDYQTMLGLIQSDAVGRPLLGRARYGWDGPDWGKWFYAQGGGPLFDLGVYSITSLTGLLGSVTHVTALSTTSRPERIVDGEPTPVETDDTYQILLRHETGALSTVTTAFGMQKYKGPAVEVYGLEGTVQLLGDDWAPEGIELWKNQDGYWSYFEGQSRNWPWTCGLTHLINCVQDGTPPYVTPEHSYHVLEVMFRAMTSSDSGHIQQVTSRFTTPTCINPNPTSLPQRTHDRTRTQGH